MSHGHIAIVIKAIIIARPDNLNLLGINFVLSIASKHDNGVLAFNGPFNSIKNKRKKYY